MTRKDNGAMFGADLNSYRPVVNFAAACGAVDFMITKATQGTRYVDKTVAPNFHGFAGKPRGCYHYTDMSPVADEVAHFVSVWKQFPWEIDPILDAECAGITGEYVRAWIAEFRRQTGHKSVGVYSGASLMQSALNPSAYCDANVWLWVARYRKSGRPDATAAGLGSYLGWWHPAIRVVQYDDATSIAGVAQPVDVNLALALTTKTGEAEDMTPQEHDWLYGLWQAMFSGSHTAVAQYPSLLAIEAETQRRVTANGTSIAAVQGALSKSQAALLAAIAGADTATTLSDDQVNAIVAALSQSLPAGVVKTLGQRMAAGA